MRNQEAGTIPDQAVLRLEGLKKQYGSVVAVGGIDLEIYEGEFVTLLGPSGCGKTTTIRMIGGYVEPTGGRIVLDGKEITRLSPQRRNMGMVFQQYALFPHMTINDNIAYPLRLRKWSKDRVKARVAEMLDLVRLKDVGQRHPFELSGGQQQRIALARALAFSPRMLLMDEALGALDAKLREYMQEEIRRIQRELKITTIHVTHDQDEALGMSDRVVVMRESLISQVAEPRELYEQPDNAYVADFIGRINLLPAKIVERDGETTVVEVDLELPEASLRRVVVDAVTDRTVGSPVLIGIRPENMVLRTDPTPENRLAVSVQASRFGGALEYLTVEVAPGKTLMALRDASVQSGGGPLYLHWPRNKTILLDPN